MSRAWRLRCRPIIGLLIRDRELTSPTRFYYIVEHPRTHTYWIDPYHVRTSGVEWGPYRRAWRFPNRDTATETMAAERVAGTIREIPLP